MLDALHPTCPTERRRPAAPDATWTAWPTAGELEPQDALRNLYTSYLTFGTKVDDLDEVVAALRSRLALFHLMISTDERGRAVLILTLESDDLWLAVLQSMNAVRATGYEAVAVLTVPAGEVETGPDRVLGGRPDARGADSAQI